MIKNELEKIGLNNVRLEPYPVICRTCKSSEIEIMLPVRKKMPCKYGASSGGTSPNGITAEIIDAGFGTIRDFERLKSNGIDVKDNIPLIERNDRLTLWPDIPVHQASEFGAAAVVFTSALHEHTALKTDVIPNVSTPVLFIPYIEAQKIRDLLRKGKVEANLKNVIEVDEKGVSYNVAGELEGSKFPDQIIAVTTHHDSFFGGANDNASAVAIMLEIAKIFSRNYKTKRTIKFISFGAEEAGANTIFDWAVESFEYVNKHSEEMENTVANINLDVPAFGDAILLRATPESELLVVKHIKKHSFQVLPKLHTFHDS